MVSVYVCVYRCLCVYMLFFVNACRRTHMCVCVCARRPAMSNGTARGQDYFETFNRASLVTLRKEVARGATLTPQLRRHAPRGDQPSPAGPGRADRQEQSGIRSQTYSLLPPPPFLVFFLPSIGSSSPPSPSPLVLHQSGCIDHLANLHVDVASLPGVCITEFTVRNVSTILHCSFRILLHSRLSTCRPSLKSSDVLSICHC